MKHIHKSLAVSAVVGVGLGLLAHLFFPAHLLRPVHESSASPDPRSAVRASQLLNCFSLRLSDLAGVLARLATIPLEAKEFEETVFQSLIPGMDQVNQAILDLHRERVGLTVKISRSSAADRTPICAMEAAESGWFADLRWEISAALTTVITTWQYETRSTPESDVAYRQKMADLRHDRGERWPLLARQLAEQAARFRRTDSPRCD